MSKVSNPLTIVAIFASLAEVACSGALIALDGDVQSIFVWFVMLFPSALVLLFFVTLWWKPTSLYAPGDYADESNFLEAIGVTINLSKTVASIKAAIDEMETKIKSNNGNRELELEIDALKKKLDSSQVQFSEAQKVLARNIEAHRSTPVNLSVSNTLVSELKNIANEKGVSVNSILQDYITKNLKKYE